MLNGCKTISIKLPKLDLDREAIAKRLRVPENSGKSNRLCEMIEAIENMSEPAIHFRRLEPIFMGDNIIVFDDEKIESESLNKKLFS